METVTPPQGTDKAKATVSEQKSSLRVTDAIILALASAGAYLFAFFYERGFASFFGIPTQLINVSLVTLLIFGASTFTFLYVLAYLIEATLPLMRFKYPYLQFKIPRLLLLL